MLIHYIHRPKKNNHIISLDVEKLFDKTQYPFLIKSLSKIGKKKNIPNFIRAFPQY